jgi:hypothetical protein
MTMTPGRIALLFVVAALAGCYRPNVQDAGLWCADAGSKACPEGFHCGADRRCHAGPTTMCPSDAAVMPLCSDQPLGAQCDPICQQGCECGQRCNLDGENLKCVASGSKVAGDYCNLMSDDCAAGLVCLKEQCSAEDAGPQVGRCYRYCAGDQHCGGMMCNVQVISAAATPLSACQLPQRACDPVSATTTCGNALLACYVVDSGGTYCECPGFAGPGEACGVFSSCVPGYRCVQQGVMTPRCRKVCRLGGSSDCPATSTCTQTPADATFGYCNP